MCNVNEVQEIKGYITKVFVAHQYYGNQVIFQWTNAAHVQLYRLNII